MFKLISIVVSGLMVGLAARFFYPGTVEMGLGRTILLGIAGSLVAGFLGRAMGLYHAGDAGPGIIASVIGAVILLAAYRLIARRRLT